MAPEPTRSPDSTSVWDTVTGRGDPDQRYQLRRLCVCENCGGSGKKVVNPEHRGKWPLKTEDTTRCPECRGEGRVLELVATMGTPEAVGIALVQLAQEGEFAECPIGLLDLMGDTNQKWLIRPWLPEGSARIASVAGRTLQRRRRLTK